VQIVSSGLEYVMTKSHASASALRTLPMLLQLWLCPH